MNVLAIEYSSQQRSVGIACAKPGVPSTAFEVVETGGRAANTFAMIDQALAQAGLEREQIDCVAIGVGPGSYTGIRAAISTAQGWQLATGLRLLAIGSVDAIVAEAVDQGVSGPAAVVIDAQRGEFYIATYNLGTRPELISELRIVGPDEVLKAEQEGATLIGPAELQGARNFRLVLPRASVLAELALSRTDFVPGESIIPIYLRETTFVKHTPVRQQPT